MPAVAADAVGAASWGSLNETALKRRFHAEASERESAVVFVEMNHQTLMRKLVDVFCTFTNQIKFEFNEEGMLTVSMDSSQTAMLDFQVKKECFETYDVKRPTVVGLDLGTFKDVLASGSQDDFLRLWTDESEYIYLALFNRKYDSLTQQFKWKKINIEDEDLTAPNLNKKAGLVMPSWEFKDRMGDYKNIGDHVEFSIHKHHVTFRAQDGKRTIDYYLDVKVDSDESIKEETDKLEGGEAGAEDAFALESRIKVDDEMSGFKRTYNMKILEMIAKAGNLAKEIKIYFDFEMPSCFHFDIEDDPNKGHARIWMAPQTAEMADIEGGGADAME